MSYNLDLTPRTTIGAAEILAYFAGRSHYTLEGDQAGYLNTDTDVYFAFSIPRQPSPEHPVTFELNYFRPSTFALEAERELTSFVRAFDCTVDDPQVDGMGSGPYDPQAFVAGWNAGNALTYESVLRDEADGLTFATMPAAQLHDTWRWNLNRGSLQEDVGPSRFVPRVMAAVVDEATCTVVVWPDGIPIVTPPVDYLLVARDQLAPIRGVERTADTALIAWDDAMVVLSQLITPRDGGAVAFDYDSPPKDVQRYVTDLPALEDGALEGLPWDNVLDAELFDRYAPAPEETD